MPLYDIRFGRNINYPDVSQILDVGPKFIFCDSYTDTRETPQQDDDIVYGLDAAIAVAQNNNFDTIFETDLDPTLDLARLRTSAGYEIEFECEAGKGLNVAQHGRLARRSSRECPEDGKYIIIGDLRPVNEYTSPNPDREIRPLSGWVQSNHRDIFSEARDPASTPVPPRNQLNGISTNRAVPHRRSLNPKQADELASPPIKFRIKFQDTTKFDIAYLLKLLIEFKVTCKKTGQSVDFNLPAFFDGTDPAVDCIFKISKKENPDEQIIIKHNLGIADPANPDQFWETTLTRQFLESGYNVRTPVNKFQFLSIPGAPTPSQLVEAIPNANNWKIETLDPELPKYRWKVLDIDDNFIGSIITDDLDDAQALTTAQEQYGQNAHKVADPSIVLGKNGNKISIGQPNPNQNSRSIYQDRINRLLRVFLSNRIEQLKTTIKDELQNGLWSDPAGPGESCGDIDDAPFENNDCSEAIELLDKCDTVIEIQGFSVREGAEWNISLKNSVEGIFLYDKSYYGIPDDALEVDSVENIEKLFRRTR